MNLSMVSELPDIITIKEICWYMIISDIFSPFLLMGLQDFRNGKIDTAFIPKHEKELATVSIKLLHLPSRISSFFKFTFL